jgi:hypothetical protein
MTTTIVVWTLETPGPEAGAIIGAQAAEMALAGKTDNTPVEVDIGEQRTFTRTWTTLADAEEWIAFVEQYNPVSATIQS